MSRLLRRLLVVPALISAAVAGGCASLPEYAITNASATATVPRKVILVPFIIDSKVSTGRSGSKLLGRGTEAAVVVRDELEPYLLEQMRAQLAIDAYVEPETVAVKSVKKILPERYFERVAELLATYAKHSAVDPDELAVLIDAIDPAADGIVFIRIDEWDCFEKMEEGRIGMRGYFFIKTRAKAAWVAQDGGPKVRSHQASIGYDGCGQEGYRNEGRAKLDVLIGSMPFRR